MTGEILNVMVMTLENYYPIVKIENDVVLAGTQEDFDYYSEVGVGGVTYFESPKDVENFLLDEAISSIRGY